MRSIFRAVVAAGVLALAAPAAPALASDFTLHLSVPSDPVVGQPTILRATGTIPLRDLDYLYWFSLDFIPLSATTTCPEDRWESAQIATGTGGGIIVLKEQQRPDAAGNFSIPVGIRPTAAGKVLLCAYTDDGEATTLARTSMVLNIRPSSAAKKRSPRAIRRAKARCRKLHSPRARRSCLRRVERGR
jgi:hypothetical protein